MDKLDQNVIKALKTEGHPISQQQRNRDTVREPRILAYENWNEYYNRLSKSYDFVRGLPTKSCLENYEKAKKELIELGLPL
ncbi:MAG: hypothetical protein QXI32_05000 [Candidatus Bathyarchaeia archaeon]